MTIKFTVTQKHISLIQAGDYVVVEGELQGVGRKDLQTGGFMGTTLFGDSYRGGRVLVDVATIYKAMPSGWVVSV